MVPKSIPSYEKINETNQVTQDKETLQPKTRTLAHNQTKTYAKNERKEKEQSHYIYCPLQNSLFCW